MTGLADQWLVKSENFVGDEKFMESLLILGRIIFFSNLLIYWGGEGRGRGEFSIWTHVLFLNRNDVLSHDLLDNFFLLKCVQLKLDVLESYIIT